MGKVTGFLEIDRQDRRYKPASDRIRHFKEFMIPLSEEATKDQAARCMNCGIPYCMGNGSLAPGTPGCPVNNQIPDWNDLVYRGDWQERALQSALDQQFSRVHRPRVPGAVRGLVHAQPDRDAGHHQDDRVRDRRSRLGGRLDHPRAPGDQDRQKVSVIGSGPAGMACAQQLARAGHEVHLFEKFARAGGLLTYGIPDFKMEKRHVARRVTQMEAEGVVFHYGAHVGVSLAVERVTEGFDAVVLTGGAEHSRDLPIPGRELGGIHFAMDYLPQQNRRIAGEPVNDAPISAARKHVVVIGGGDTGSDCIGTAIRQGALSVTNFEIMPKPPEKEDKLMTWPNWPLKLRTSSSHEEGAERDFAVMTEKFTGQHGQVQKLHCIRCDEKFKPIPGTEFELKADLVLLAMGFVHPVHEGMVKTLGLDLDPRGNVKADTETYQTSNPKVFTAGDMRRGQSLVVWAIREGRQAAHAVDKFLMGSTNLPR